jgi:Flp pilus assembly pilin Flp
MTRHFKLLLRDQRGATLVEFAIALPLLVVLIYSIFTWGMVFQANAGLQHALGEAARYATIFPTPSDDDIKARIASTDFGLGGGTLEEPEIDNSNLVTGGYKTITLEYSRPTNFLFFQGPTVTLIRSKRVYVSN